MATHYIHKFGSIGAFSADSPSRPNAGGIGVVDGAVWVNLGSGPVPLSAAGFGQSGVVRYVNPAVSTAYQTIAAAIAASSQGDTILIAPLEAESASGDTDPDSYAETLIIPAGLDGLSLVGIARGLTQGGQPQIKIGAGATAMIEVQAFGCLIAGLTINGAGSTGGGIKITSNGSTQDAGGLVVAGNHFKNCKGSASAQDAAAIFWSTNGASWYPMIVGNNFFDCRIGVLLPGTGIDRPKDVKIIGNRFYSSANTTVDCDILLSGGSGVNGLVIDRNVFGTVDVPAYATGTVTQRYLDLTNCTNGILSNNVFACLVGPTGQTEVTFGGSGTAAKIPATVRMAANAGEAAAATGSELYAGRT
jgi:hypothetical protein